MTNEWSLTPEHREALYERREQRGIDYNLVSALEYNPTGNRNVDDIARVLARYEGEPDGELWVWLVEFEDGYRGCYLGWCDYTGWDCQSSLTLFDFDDWESIVRNEWPRYGVEDKEVDLVVSILQAQLVDIA